MLLAAVGASYGWSPTFSAAAADSTAPYMGAPGGIGYGPERQAANGLAPCAAGHPDGPLHLGVERLELVVVDRPIVDHRRPACGP